LRDAVLWKQCCKLHDLVLKFVSPDELCRRFMAIPGVGRVTALTSAQIHPLAAACSRRIALTCLK
jgi:transposase